MEGPVVTMQEIFQFVPVGLDSDGRVEGYFQATGLVPRCINRLRVAGVELPNDLFERGRRFTTGVR